MRKNFIAVLIIFIFSVLISLPLLVPGFYVVHDDQQIARLFLLDSALKDGQFPPRWVNGLGFGFGYPLFNFYPPLVYYLGELFHVLGLGFIDSVKLVFFASIFLSSLAIYIFVRELWGRASALISAVFYALLPYRAIDVYIRGAMAESFSFVWPPLILWSLYKLRAVQKSRYLVLSAAFTSALMITHNLILIPFLLILPFYAIFLIFLKPDKKKFVFFQLPTALLLFLVFSAYFWLPSIMEKRFTLVDELLLVNLANYNIHFVYPQQLWNWPWGFGGSALGLNDGLSFKIGKLHILVSLFSLIFVILFTAIRKTRSIIDLKNSQILLFFSLLVFSAFMATSYSKIIWDYIQPLDYLQFPWRFLIFTGLFSSMLAGAFIFLIKVPVFRLLAAILLVTSLLVTNLKLFKPQTFRPSLTDAQATSDETIKWGVSSSSFEYIPKGVETYKGELGTNLVNVSKSDIPQSKLEFLAGEGQISTLFTTSTKNVFLTESPEDATIRANIFNFPGWNVKVDGARVSINDQNRLKLITFKLPRGSHMVSIEFSNTPIRTVANVISLVSALAALVFFTNKKWTKILF